MSILCSADDTIIMILKAKVRFLLVLSHDKIKDFKALSVLKLNLTMIFLFEI